MMMGGTEWILVVLVVLLFFGARKLPELARSLGKSLNEFKRGKEESAAEIRKLQEDTKKPEPEDDKK